MIAACAGIEELTVSAKNDCINVIFLIKLNSDFCQ